MMTTQWRSDAKAGDKHRHHKIKRFWFLVTRAAFAWVDDNVMRLSAALSLYTILSLAPLLVITIRILGWISHGKELARQNMSRQMTILLGSQAAGAVEPIITSTSRHRYGVAATAISTAVLCFSATGAFIELQDSMNTIWGRKTKPNKKIWAFVRNRLLSLGMVFGVGFMLLLSVFVSNVLIGAESYLSVQQEWLGFLTHVVLPFGIVFVLFSAIYKFLPDVSVAWKHVWPGALMAACLFTAGKYGLQIYLAYAAPASAYGAAGSLSAILLWVYYSAFSLFYGAEFTKVSAGPQ